MRRLAYISFDQVPASKGASTHIEAFARGLAIAFGSIDLVTVSAGSKAEAPCDRWPGVVHRQLPAVGASLIERVLHFRGFLTRFLESGDYGVIHFRSIFEGLPILKHRKGAALIFEVNGLPSIELKYRYPGSQDDRELMRKLEAQERACIAAADRIITPSSVTREFLVSARGATPEKIAVIPNGADTEQFHSPGEFPASKCVRLLYFGTLSSWQGIEVAIRAVAQIEQGFLTVLGSGTGARRNALTSLAAKLGAADRIFIRPPVPKKQLADELAGCDAVLAPLLWNDRNVLQGCCPLKVLEGMAAGRPVIASDLEVVRQLGTHEEHLLLAEPGSVNSLVAAIFRLRGDPVLAAKIASNSRKQVERHYTWTCSVESLVALYHDTIGRSASKAPSPAVPAPVRS